MSKEAKPVELSISVSAGLKANLGNYESADGHASRSERWDVSELTLAEINALYAERYEAIRTEVGEIAAERYTAALKGEI